MRFDSVSTIITEAYLALESNDVTLALNRLRTATNLLEKKEKEKTKVGDVGPHCPKCGDGDVLIGQKLQGGELLKNRCGKCHHEWKPEETSTPTAINQSSLESRLASALAKL
jgi:ssDNA-binding Zn-finger/Zn-ribbon topoisomerase 1